MIRLVIADDNKLVRDGLVQYLGMSPDIQIAAEAANGEELLEKLRTITPDLLLLDMVMPGKNGAALIGQIRSIYPELKILVLSMHNETDMVLHALKAGASGYIGKDCSPQILSGAIRETVATGKYLSPSMAERLAYASTSSVQGGHESA